MYRSHFARRLPMWLLTFATAATLAGTLAGCGGSDNNNTVAVPPPPPPPPPAVSPSNPADGNASPNGSNGGTEQQSPGSTQNSSGENVAPTPENKELVQLADDWVTWFDDLASVLEGVTDEASANSAQDDMDALMRRMAILVARKKELGISNNMLATHVITHHADRISAFNERYSKVISVIRDNTNGAFNTRIAEVFGVVTSAIQGNDPDIDEKYLADATDGSGSGGEGGEPSGSVTLVHTLKPHSGHIDSIAFTLDGKRLASGSSDGEIRLFDVATGEQLNAMVTGDSRVSDMVWLSDGETVATTNRNGNLKLYNLSTARLVKEVTKPNGADGHFLISSLRLLDDGKTLAAGGASGIWLFETDNWKLKKFVKLPGAAKSLAITPDGSRALAYSSDEAVLWDLMSDVLIRSLGGWSHAENTCDAATASPDGNALAVANYDDNKVYVRSAADGAEKLTFEVKAGPGKIPETTTVAYSPDGQVLAVGVTQDVVLCDAATGKELTRLEDADTQYITALTFSPDGSRLAAGGLHRTVSIWDVSAFSGPPVASESTQPESAGPESTASPDPDFSLTAKEFSEAFANNQQAAIEKYEGKQIELTGDVSMYDVAASGTYIFLDGAKFEVVNDEPWGLALPGQTVKATGMYNSSSGVKLNIVEALGERLVVEASDLAQQFARSDDATNNKFGEKWMEVRGKVARKEATEFGGANLYLKGAGDIDVLCLASPKELDSLNVGDSVRFVGQYSKSSFDSPELTQGRLITAPIAETEIPATTSDTRTPPPEEPAGDKLRIWTSADGKFSVEAEMVKVIGPTIYLKTKDGREIQVPKDKLSDEDNAFIRSKR